VRRVRRRASSAAPRRRRWRYGAGVCAVLALAACSHRHEAAQRLIEDVDIAVLAAGPDAVKYAPQELGDVEHKLGALQAAYDRGDDRTVLESGRALLLEARGLGSVAAEHKADTQQELGTRWAQLSRRVPEALTVLEERLSAPPPSHGSGHGHDHGHAARAPAPAATDSAAARTALADAERMWSKAQGAFGNGNLSEAVSSAEDVEARIEALERPLGITPPPAPSPPAAVPGAAAPGAAAPGAAAPGAAAPVAPAGR